MRSYQAAMQKQERDQRIKHVLHQFMCGVVDGVGLCLFVALCLGVYHL